MRNESHLRKFQHESHAGTGSMMNLTASEKLNASPILHLAVCQLYSHTENTSIRDFVIYIYNICIYIYIYIYICTHTTPKKKSTFVVVLCCFLLYINAYKCI